MNYRVTIDHDVWLNYARYLWRSAYQTFQPNNILHNDNETFCIIITLLLCKVSVGYLHRLLDVIMSVAEVSFLPIQKIDCLHWTCCAMDLLPDK